MAETVDELAGRLYGLPLEDFTRERDAAARELRKAKERDTAAVVAKLPKPSQAAWSANTLAREQRGLVDDLLAAGERLREAQEAAMAGKGAEELREAGAAERAAVDALVDAARELKPSGRRPTEATLERLRNTLHAAASDEDVRRALDEGRLVEDATGGGAWGLAGFDAAPLPPREPRRAKKPARRAADTKADREEAQREERERKEREAREAEEREARQRLEAELREARAERRARDRELDRAERAAARAAERLEEAREQAEESAAELGAAREAADEARDHVARLEEQLD
ncbi:MAG TPA: hypothetical protein VHJ39_01130 [Solirubrobacteraceae bacterium]|nr:hypothetical protein [Solirubrobacteraceae bacterium]